MKWKTTKKAPKEENKDDNLWIMSNVVVFRQDSSRIIDQIIESKFMFYCFEKEP